MVVSNEPGYYEKNNFGIRIENLIYVKQNKKGMTFENLTMAPIEKDLIIKENLSKDEKKWLNNYHQNVFKNLIKSMNKMEALELKKSAIKTLAEVSTALGEVDLSEYTITVEGHTDDTPIKTSRFPSNWELSASRATSVVRALVQGGMDRRQVSALAFGDTRPVVPNVDEKGRPSSNNRERNRRVVIRVARE